jgi:hypothetical protein
LQYCGSGRRNVISGSNKESDEAHKKKRDPDAVLKPLDNCLRLRAPYLYPDRADSATAALPTTSGVPQIS